MNTQIPDIRLEDYRYQLPEERIAQRPLAERDASKLLQYQAGSISHHHFRDLPSQLPANSLLVFNDTKVIKARLYFRRATGALIEVLLMHPYAPMEVHSAMQATDSVVWECIIGNKKKWKKDETLTRELQVGEENMVLEASWEDQEKNLIRFSWSLDLAFVTWLQAAGELPLPPYIHRRAEEEDQITYQTIYAANTGAVAAPTAGLHFTDRVFAGLQEKGVHHQSVTLHVSAGTFLPVKAEKAADHDMHHEQMVITREAVLAILEHRQQGPVVVVGTTSMRWVESLYWVGYLILQGQLPESGKPFAVAKLTPYQASDSLPAVESALQAILDWMARHELSQCLAETSIMILPGYPFQICNALITNFHMPETTLMLLIAAFVGEDWRKIYDTALEQGYRFLSYGDSSLLWRKM